MKVILAEPSGACYGVDRALSMVYEAIEKSKVTGESVYTLGSLIHNPLVVKDLASKGAEVIDSPSEISSGMLIIRSHGACKGVADDARSAGINVYDATCPHVSKVQKAASDLADEGRFVVILGEIGHPEVVAIQSYAGKSAAIVQSLEEIPDLDAKTKIGLVVQTTQSKEKFFSIASRLEERFEDVKIKNTICEATRRRQKSAEDLSKEVDAMIVIGGRNSGNTTRLKEICEVSCTNTHHIESANEIDPSWFTGCESVGICAGASTPNSHIYKVVETIEGQNFEKQ